MPIHPSDEALPCFICDKVLKNVSANIINQPSGGTAFTTRGHYGSAIYDNPMNNDFIEINICDDCFLEKFTNHKVLRARRFTEVEYDDFFTLYRQEDLPIEESEHE